jgi:NAD(P)-dependent dehydrogenase (short-subunit alcohol dehydrogenase family)
MTKIALITGASRGLGKDMALALSRKGIDVIITYQSNQEDAAAVVAEIQEGGRQAVMLKLDLSTLAGLPAFIDEVSATLRRHWGVSSLDYLINNAGIGATLPIPDVTESAFDSLLNIHFKGVYFLTQKMLPLLNDQGGVVFVSSGTTRFCVPGYSVYSSLKSAVETFSRYVAKEYGPRGIRSNVIAPGPIETDFNQAAIRNNPAMKSHLASLTALGRVGQADDVGSVVAFLCSEESRWINGQRIEVSGGINL